MEEFERKFEYANAGSRRQIALRLYNTILAKKKAKKLQEPIDNTTQHQIPELQVLWSKCSSTSPAVADVCSRLCVRLVEDGQADLDYVMNNFLNLILPHPASPPAALVHGVGSLLRMQVLGLLAHFGREDGSKKCRQFYTLRTSLHPFSQILYTDPENWPLLLNQVVFLLSHPTLDTRSEEGRLKWLVFYETLLPFIKCVYLDPALGPSCYQLRASLFNQIFQICTTGSNQPISRDNQLLLLFLKTWQEIVSCLDLSSGTALQEVLQHLSDMYRQLVVQDQQTWHQEVTVIVMQLLCVSHAMLLAGQHATIALKELKTAMEGLASVDNVVFVALSNLLMHAPMFGPTLGYLIDLVSHVLDKSSPPPLTLNMLVLPLLKIISAQSILQDSSNRGILLTANRLLARTTSTEDKLTASQRHSRELPPLNHTWYCLMEECEALTRTMGSDSSAASQWLGSVEASLGHPSSCQVQDWLLQLVSGLLCWTQASTALTSSALTLLVKVAQADDTKGPDILPLLLYKLHHEHRSQVKFEVLEVLPGLATHRLHVAPVLRTLQLLASSPDMYPLALRLVTKLWTAQDRCFPQLLKMLDSSPAASTKKQVYEFRLAIAASIRDVCLTRPSQHGEDMVPKISAMLGEYGEPADGAAVGLVLDALHYLCQAEVLDLHTTWQALAHKLRPESRIHPLVKVCKLLSLVPELHVETDDYEEFRSQAISLLWKHSGHPNPLVANAAFNALSNFEQDEFTPTLLKSSRWAPVIRGVISSSSAAADEGAVGGDDETEEGSSLSGEMYVAILKQMPQASLPGYGDLLTSLIYQEVEDLPRGIAFSATKKSQRDKPSLALSADIPATILSLYQSNKQPALRPGLASGLLLCYNPAAPEVGKDGQPTRRSLLKFGRNYLQTMNTLVSEVVFDPKDWQRNLFMPQAFEQFMVKLYRAVLQCNLVEMEIQKEQTNVKDESKTSECWLWTFEKICDQLKSAFGRGSSSVQANCIMALVGLGVAVYHYKSSLKAETAEGQQHLDQKSWFKVVTHTLLHAAFPDYKSGGKALFACSPRNTAMNITSLCAVSRLIPPALEEPELAGEILDLFLGSTLPADDASGSLESMYRGVGLGATVAALYQNHYDLTASSQEVEKLVQARECLEKKCGSHTATLSSGGDPGSVVGHGLVLAALCGRTEADLQTHVKKNLDWLKDQLKNSPGKKGNQVLCYSLSCVSAAAYSGHLISTEELEEVARSIGELHRQNPRNAILLQCKGLVLNGLVHSGKSDWSRAFDQYFEELAELLTSQDEQLSALYGLVALTGWERHLLGASSSAAVATEHIGRKLNKFASILIEILNSYGNDFSWQNHAAWSLGYLYHFSSAMSSSKSGTQMPSDYSYLPKGSLLRAVVGCLQEMVASQGSGGALAERCLPTILASLASPASAVTYPPLNWVSLLGPLQKQGCGELVEESYLKLMLRQCQHSTGGSLLLQATLQPLMFSRLQEGSKKLVLSGLPYLIKGKLPTSLLKEFIDWNCSQLFSTNSKPSPDLVHSLITGIGQSLKTPNLPPPLLAMLHQSLERTKVHFEGPLAKDCHLKVLKAFSESISLLPDLHQDKLTQDLGLMGMLVRCYLVSCGRQPINWLNDSIETVANGNQAGNHAKTSSRLLAALAITFSNLDLNQDTSASSMSKLQWLLELMGHVRSLWGRKKRRTNVEFLLAVFAVAVTAFSADQFFHLLGVRTAWTLEKGEGEAESQCAWPLTHGDEFPLSRTVDALPASLSSLLRMHPWSQIVDKVLIWLTIMCEEFPKSISNLYRKGLQESLFALRNSPEFQKQSIWRRVYSIEYNS